jgi:hypothetical protein
MLRSISLARKVLFVLAFALVAVCGLLSIVCLAIALQSSGRDLIAIAFASLAWSCVGAAVLYYGAAADRALLELYLAATRYRMRALNERSYRA